MQHLTKVQNSFSSHYLMYIQHKLIELERDVAQR